MLANMDPNTIGAQMAKALITTFYGSLFANALCIPLAKRLEQITGGEINIYEAIQEGLLSIQAQESPTITQARLLAFLSPNMRNLFEERVDNIDE